MNKDQLTKLAALNNPKTNKYLEDFAIETKERILTAKTNEDIIAHLELLSAMYYRAPKVVAEIIKYLIYEAKPIEQTIHKSPMGKFPGEDHDSVIIKTLELTKEIRYYFQDESIKIAFDLSKSENKNIQSSALKLIEEIVEYNYQVLPKIGIVPQLKAIEFVEKEIPFATQKENIPFIKIVIQHLLETSSRTFLMSSPDTFTMSSGDISGHVNIAKIRRRTIVFTINLFKKIELIEDKKSLFNNIEQACQMPMNSPRESELGMIIQEDRKFILQELKKIVFKGGKVIQPLSICLQVEHLLYWFFLHMELQQDLALEFMKLIYKDSRYKAFSAFVHDDSFRYGKTEYKEIKQEAQTSIQQYVDKVSGVLDFDDLEDIATEAKNVDEWKIASFKQLLEELGCVKPEVAFVFIKKTISKKTSLSDPRFLPFLLSGLRKSKRFDLWDDVYDIVVKSKNQNFVIAIMGSMFVTFSETPELTLRKKDISIVSNIVNRKGDLSFLGEEKINNLLRHFTINVLKLITKVDPKKSEKLIITELKNNPDYLLAYLQTISIYVKGDDFGINKWSKSSKNFLLNQILPLDNIDWHLQWFLPSLCDTPEKVVDFFIKRINLREKKYSDEDFFISERRHYDAIPFDFNHELVEFVQKDYKKTVDLIVKNLSPDYSVKSIELASLIKNLKINENDILDTLSKEGEVNDVTLKKIIGSLPHVDANDPDFLVKLAGKSSNKKIHERLYSKLASTGVVSGEFGIADAYKQKREALEKYKNSKNKNVKKFVKMSIEWLKESEDRARKSAEEEIESRRIDFESK